MLYTYAKSTSTANLMITPISALSAIMYRHIIKRVLFRIHPDHVHSHLMRIGGTVSNSRVACWMLARSWRYQNASYLGQTVAGVRFENPVGLSAGFDNNITLSPLLKAVGFGFEEGGSVTYKYCPGNPRPWFHRLPHTKSLVVHKGLGNAGMPAVIERLRRYPLTTFTDFPLNISVAKTNLPTACSVDDAITDYIGSLKLIKQHCIGSFVTINISCPNTYGGEPFTTPAKLKRLLEAVDAIQLDKPLFLKMPSDLSWHQFKQLADVADLHGVTGLTIHNLAKTRVNIDPRDTLNDTIKGNLSGKPTWDSSNTLIQKTRQTYGDRFVIIGVGGIFSAQDAYTKIRLGADMVELITGMIFEGPQLIGQINRGLVQLLKADGYTNISQARSVDTDTR